MKKDEFIVKIKDKEVQLKTSPITSAIRSESNIWHNKAFHDALQAGLQLRMEVERMLDSRGLLDSTNNEAKAKALRKEIKDLEVELRQCIRDGRRMTPLEGRGIAIKMKSLRNQLGDIGANLNNYFGNTVESAADNERFRFFIYACTIYPDNADRFWKSFEAFKVEDNAELIQKASDAFLASTAGIDPDYEKQFYENKWLIKMRFMNDKMQLLNDQGALVDLDGRLIDQDGRFINDKGQFIDAYGNPVDNDGNLLIEDAWEVPKEPLDVEKASS